MSDLVVLEVGVAMAGPFCGMMLADYGADVVKVERIGHGDESRHWAPFFEGGVSHYFAAVNRNKRSLAVDLKTDRGVNILKELATTCDVLIDNFRPGALDDLGIGYERLKELNPRLIYCSISGFGASGPRADQRANDVAVQAFSGGMSITGEPGRGPVKMGISVADVGAGMFATIGILMALEDRHRSGRGQRVDTSLLEGQMSMLSYHVSAYFASGRAPAAMGSSAQGLVPYQAFKAKDRWMVVAVFTDRMWRDLCGVVDKPEWVADPRFVSPALRKQNRADIIPVLENVFSERQFAYWADQFSGVGIPCTPVNSIDQVVEDEQVAERQLIQTLVHPKSGVVKVVGLPIKLDCSPGALVSAPPLLGEHSVQVLEQLGYSKEVVENLEKHGVIERPSTQAGQEDQ